MSDRETQLRAMRSALARLRQGDSTKDGGRTERINARIGEAEMLPDEPPPAPPTPPTRDYEVDLREQQNRRR